jgi:hypothetical protein
MRKFLSMTKGKLANNGFQPMTKTKLDILTEAEDAQASFLYILENLGLHACLEAMGSAPYEHEEHVDRTLRLLAIDAAYRAMPLWEGTEIAQDGLRELMRMAHLHAHGEIEYEELQERLWETAQPIMNTNVEESSLTRDARDCALLTGSHDLIPALNKAVEAARTHHGAMAKICAYGKCCPDRFLRYAWREGGPIVFGATFGVASRHVLATAEAEVWHAAYTIADELLNLVGSKGTAVTVKEMEDFLLEALASAAKDIAHEVVHKGARQVIESVMPARTYDEAYRMGQDAAQGFFRNACERPDLYEQLAIGRTTLAAACHDFEDHDTFIISHALYYLHEVSFYETYPLNPDADRIAKRVALDARKQLHLDMVAYAAAGSYAGEREADAQAEVLARLLSEDQ